MGSGPSQPRWFGTLRASLPPMKDKTVVITGTTSGTGYICAQVCGELGATILLLNRSSQRSAKALESLRAAAPNGTFHAVECDLQSFASVRTAAAEVAKLTPEGIDVLCNNAGVMALEDVATKDGFDVQMQTNHLSHFLLTALLFPLLEKRAAAVGEARVVNHSSVARRMPDTPLSAAHLGKNGGNLGGNASGISMSGPRWERYHQTKLANCIFTYALHDRLQKRGSKVKALVAHPGLARTNLQVTSGEHGGMSPTFTGIFMKMLSQSGEDGAMGIVKCVCDSADAVASGQFWGPNRGMQLTGAPGLVTPEPLLNGEEDKKMLWQLSEEAVGEKFAL